MGIFSRGRGLGGSGGTGSASVVPAAERPRLAQVGRTVYAEGGFVDVSGFYLEPFMQLGLPTDQFAERLVADLTAIAAAAPDEWAYPGALYVAVDFDGGNLAARTAGEALIDPALRVLAGRGVGGERIPFFLLSRWSDITSGGA